MAMYHLHARFVQRSKGMSAFASAMYRAGEKGRDEQSGKRYDFTHKTHVAHKEVLLPDHVPDWLADRHRLWNTVETTLNHKNGQPAFEVEVALPRELSEEQRLELVRGFAEKQFVQKGLIVDLCIHNGQASDGGEHPHAHMLITTRRWNDDGSMGKAARDLQDNPKLIGKIYALEEAGEIEQALLLSKGTHLAHWRKEWATETNDFLERYEHEDRVDERTLAAQQIEREAMPHIGVAFHAQREGLRGWLARRVDAFKEFKWPENWRDAMREQFERIRHKAPDLQADFFAHAREYAPDFYPELKQQTPDRGIEHER